jgi:hypothetical protein
MIAMSPKLRRKYSERGEKELGLAVALRRAAGT